MCTYEYIHKILYDYFISYFIIPYLSLPHTRAGGGDQDECLTLTMAYCNTLNFNTAANRYS